MLGKRSRKIVAAAFTGCIFTALLLSWCPFDENSAGQQQQKTKRKPRPEDQPVAMSTDSVQLQLVMGLKDKKGQTWSGNVTVENGKLRSMDIKAGGKAKVTGTSYIGSSFKKKKGQPKFVRPKLTMVIDKVNPETKVTVNTKNGVVQFTLADLPTDKIKKFLEGQVSVKQQPGAIRLTSSYADDDYPAMAKGNKGDVWLVYNEYVSGPEFNKERVLAGNFEVLVPSGNGDQLRLRRFDGKTWHPSIAVTDHSLDIWRPTVAVNGQGNVTIAWAEQKDNNWEIYHRTYTPANGKKGSWSKITRVSNNPGSDFHVVAATDAKGVVWLAWQSWDDGHFQTKLAAVAENHPYSEPKVISTSKSNNWSPAIAADSRGNVFVAWDAYDGDSYNVHLHQVGKETKTINVADSPRFEARPNLLCDAQDRLWIAYEQGDEQWGKDYSTKQFQKIGFKSNPGNGLYINRTIQVKCLVDGKLMQPAGDLQKAFGKTLPRNKSLARMAVDGDGGLWLTVRHHPNALGAGEVWESFAVRYNGETWSTPEKIANSKNLMDNRPALVAVKDGILEVHSSDDRTRGAIRKQTNLFAVLLQAKGKTLPESKLVANQPVKGRMIESVHPNEAKDVTRIRKYTIDYKGKKLRLFRGEFHRHTEYTAHRDQDGLLEDSWRYSLDASSMDWMGNGDHDNGFGYEYMWWQIQKITDLYHNPPNFVAAQTYERSNKYPNGHRNVIMPKRGIRPLPRGNLKGTPEDGTPDTKILYAFLKRFGGICASHTSGTNMGTDWRDNDPLVEPIVEIYQGHRHSYEHFGAPRSATKETQIGGYQKAGYVWNAFKKGIRFGFQSSSDHMSTHMSYAIVLTADLSRQGMIDAFKKRHCYAATDNIIMDVRSGENLMGDVFTSKERPSLEIKVLGTSPIAKLHVIRNNEYVYSIKPNKQEVNIRYSDAKPVAGEEAFYYVRIEQEDGNVAWASPMWITYQPK